MVITLERTRKFNVSRDSRPYQSSKLYISEAVLHKKKVTRSSKALNNKCIAVQKLTPHRSIMPGPTMPGTVLICCPFFWYSSRFMGLQMSPYMTANLFCRLYWNTLHTATDRSMRKCGNINRNCRIISRIISWWAAYLSCSVIPINDVTIE